MKNYQIAFLSLVIAEAHGLHVIGLFCAVFVMVDFIIDLLVNFSRD